jgi:formate--tetrahydrofolate ligase
VKTDIDIARAAEIKAIEIIAAKVGIGDEYLEQYGKYKAKVNLSIIPETLKDHKMAN